MPESQDFDAGCLCVDLVVKVVAGAAQKEAANTLFLGVASPRSDPWLGRDEFEGSLEVLDKGERGRRTIGSPPR